MSNITSSKITYTTGTGEDSCLVLEDDPSRTGPRTVVKACSAEFAELIARLLTEHEDVPQPEHLESTSTLMKFNPILNCLLCNADGPSTFTASFSNED